MVAAQLTTNSRVAAGFDQAALDNAALLGFSNGAFEDSEEDSRANVEEFYPLTADDEPGHESPIKRPTTKANPSLAAKLESKVQQISAAH